MAKKHSEQMPKVTEFIYCPFCGTHNVEADLHTDNEEEQLCIIICKDCGDVVNVSA